MPCAIQKLWIGLMCNKSFGRYQGEHNYKRHFTWKIYENRSVKQTYNGHTQQRNRYLKNNINANNNTSCVFFSFVLGFFNIVFKGKTHIITKDSLYHIIFLIKFNSNTDIVHTVFFFIIIIIFNINNHTI